MLHLITTVTDSFIEYADDDPVRPELSKEFRVSKNRFIATLLDNGQPSSMVCVSMHDFIPHAVECLHNTVSSPTVIIFYSIWSYKPGSGAKLLLETVNYIKQLYPTADRFVTLSPKTELARKFHTRNGAVVFRENSDTINYDYSSLR